MFAFRNLEDSLKGILTLSGIGKFLVKKKEAKLIILKSILIDKQLVLKNLKKHKSDSYVMWLDHASFIIKLGDTTIITDPVFEKLLWIFSSVQKNILESPLNSKRNSRNKFIFINVIIIMII